MDSVNPNLATIPPPPHNVEKITAVISKETGGKSYNAYKYSLDETERPQVDYETQSITWKKNAETNPQKNYVQLEEKTNDSIFTYFLDGSRRVFKVDDIAYQESGGRSSIYPIVAGQIGVGCCGRKNKKLKPIKFKKEIIISVPDKADADGKTGFFSALAKKITNPKVTIDSVVPYKTAKNDDSKFIDRGTACIQDRMIEKEKELVAELVKEGMLGQDNYLVKDGSLEYNPTKNDRTDTKKYLKFKNNYNWVIGISKSFNPEVCLDINGKANPGFIADLPLYHRTPVACYENPDYLGDIQFAVWYVRLRSKEKTRTPFSGIVKIEKILVTDNEIERGMDSELVNLISTNIINERNPTCYGSDLRWANHIYPIYLTECFVKSKYLSKEYFLQLF